MVLVFGSACELDCQPVAPRNALVFPWRPAPAGANIDATDDAIRQRVGFGK
jgi:hypothetical protein